MCGVLCECQCVVCCVSVSMCGVVCVSMCECGVCVNV